MECLEAHQFLRLFFSLLLLLLLLLQVFPAWHDIAVLVLRVDGTPHHTVPSMLLINSTHSLTLESLYFTSEHDRGCSPADSRSCVFEGEIITLNTGLETPHSEKGFVNRHSTADTNWTKHRTTHSLTSSRISCFSYVPNSVSLFISGCWLHIQGHPRHPRQLCCDPSSHNGRLGRIRTEKSRELERHKTE